MNNDKAKNRIHFCLEWEKRLKNSSMSISPTNSRYFSSSLLMIIKSKMNSFICLQSPASFLLYQIIRNKSNYDDSSCSLSIYSMLGFSLCKSRTSPQSIRFHSSSFSNTSNHSIFPCLDLRLLHSHLAFHTIENSSSWFQY